MFHPNKDQIKDIVERRLIRIDEEAKKNFPSVLLADPIRWFSFANEKFFALIFLTETENRRLEHFQQKQLYPFPGLVTTTPGSPSVFSLTGSQFASMIGNTVANSNSFFVGPDTSFFILNHTQILKTIEEGEITYTIPLAYILSFGVDITPDNTYQVLEELIVYSIKIWRKSHGQ